MPTLYLFVGFPGAGKTTIARWICGATGAVHIWADKERKEMFIHPTHSHKESQELYAYLNARVEEHLQAGTSVVFDTNFNFREDREHMRKIARRAGAEIVIIWVRTAKDIAKHRAVNDSHDKPTRLFGNMHSRTWDRIAGHLQPPTNEPDVIELDGADLDKEETLQRLEIF